MIDFTTYQKQAMTTAIYPAKGTGNYTYPALGLAGETGEVCEKLKKTIRDDGGIISPERKAWIEKELGDVLWYVAALATELQLDLGVIAQKNLDKLSARMRNNAIHGEGDAR